MADNLSNASCDPFHLTDHAVVALEGVDALGFAQAQFSNDSSNLAVGQWQWNAWLTPKGRVIAVFALFRRSADQVLLIVPDYPAELLATQLSRFVFRRKLKVSAPADLQLGGQFAPPTAARGAVSAEGEAGIELDWGGEGGPRRLLIAPPPGVANPAQLAHWYRYDLQHGLPRLDEAQREQWTAQQLSLERLPAFSVKKGCYPGQEIVARTHFLGKAKRGLVGLQAETLLLSDAEVALAGAPIGKLIASTTDAPGFALAVLPLERDAAALSVGGTPAQEIPLQDGLQRP